MANSSRGNQSGIAFVEQDGVRATIQNRRALAHEDQQVTSEPDALTIKGVVTQVDPLEAETAVTRAQRFPLGPGDPARPVQYALGHLDFGARVSSKGRKIGSAGVR